MGRHIAPDDNYWLDDEIEEISPAEIQAALGTTHLDSLTIE